MQTVGNERYRPIMSWKIVEREESDHFPQLPNKEASRLHHAPKQPKKKAQAFEAFLVLDKLSDAALIEASSSKVDKRSSLGVVRHAYMACLIGKLRLNMQAIQATSLTRKVPYCFLSAFLVSMNDRNPPDNSKCYKKC